MKRGSVVSVFVEKHSADGRPKNSGKSPGRENQSIVCAGVARAVKIGDGRGNYGGLRSVTEVNDKDQDVETGNAGANPVQRGHRDTGNNQNTPQRVKPPHQVREPARNNPAADVAERSDEDR